MPDRPAPPSRKPRRPSPLAEAVRALGRTSRRGGLDPNDRRVDHGTTKRLRQTSPEALDRLLHEDE